MGRRPGEAGILRPLGASCLARARSASLESLPWRWARSWPGSAEPPSGLPETGRTKPRKEVARRPRERGWTGIPGRTVTGTARAGWSLHGSPRGPAVSGPVLCGRPPGTLGRPAPGSPGGPPPAASSHSLQSDRPWLPSGCSSRARPPGTVPQAKDPTARNSPPPGTHLCPQDPGAGAGGRGCWNERFLKALGESPAGPQANATQ